MISNRAKIARAALYLFMFSINFEVFNLLGDSGNFSVGRLTGYIYIAAFFYARYHINFQQFHQLRFSLFAFLGVITFSSLVNINHISSRIIDLSLLQNIFLFFLLLNHESYDPGVLKTSIYSFAFGTTILMVLYFYGIGVEYTGGRLSLFDDNENIIGIRMAISSIFLIYSIITLGEKLYFKKIIMALPIPFLIYVMIETSSRVAFISFSTMLLVMLVLYLLINPIKRFILVVMISGLVAYFLLPYIFSNDLLISRLLSSKDGDLAGRDNIWISYISFIWESPIFGYGFSGFDEVSTNIFGSLASPHNVIIEVLLYSGFVGLILYMWFNAQVIYRGVLKYSLKKEYLGLLLLIPYLGSILSAQVLTHKIMWFILAFNCISLLKDKQIIPYVAKNISPRH